MRLYEFHCRKCQSFVDSQEEVVICPECGSDEIKVSYYEQMTIKRLITRMAKIEAELAALKAYLDEEPEVLDH